MFSDNPILAHYLPVFLEVFLLTNLGKLVENNWSKILSEKLVEKQLAKKCQAENSQEQKRISDKYSDSFVIVLRYEVLNYNGVLHCKL